MALIELARLGVPVVASAVGGVPELVTEQTGWPVPADAPAEAYVAALRDMLSRPEERVTRAARLQAVACGRHAPEEYDRRIAAILAGGSVA